MHVTLVAPYVCCQLDLHVIHVYDTRRISHTLIVAVYPVYHSHSVYSIAEVINSVANETFIARCGEAPETGNRRSEVWSCCFQGGTFDRIKQRCMSLCVCAYTATTYYDTA